MIGTAAGVASDMLKSVPIFSATTIKRCEVEQKYHIEGIGESIIYKLKESSNNRSKTWA